MTYNHALMFKIEGPQMMPLPSGCVRGGFFFQRFRQFAQNAGGSYQSILERNQINLAAVDDPDYPLDGELASGLFEDCCSLLNDSFFGFHLADFQDEDALGSIAVLARAAPTMRVALQSMIEYLPVFQSPGCDIEFVTTATTAEYRWRPYSGFSEVEPAIHHGLIVVAKLLTRLGGPGFRFRYASTVTGMRRAKEQAERRLGCSVQGNATANLVGFDASHLDQPLSSANPVVFGLMNSYLSEIKASAFPSLVEHVEAYVRSSLRSGNCTIERCASRMKTSARTLQKRLSELGLAFSDIVDQERFEAAKHTLLNTDYSLEEIADYLGYAEKSSFSRAFKRWAQMSPRAFRERERIRIFS